MNFLINAYNALCCFWQYTFSRPLTHFQKCFHIINSEHGVKQAVPCDLCWGRGCCCGSLPWQQRADVPPPQSINIHGLHLTEISIDPTLRGTMVHTDSWQRGRHRDDWSHTKDDAVFERLICLIEGATEDRKQLRTFLWNSAETTGKNTHREHGQNLIHDWHEIKCLKSLGQKHTQMQEALLVSNIPQFYIPDHISHE